MVRSAGAVLLPGHVVSKGRLDLLHLLPYGLGRARQLVLIRQVLVDQFDLRSWLLTKDSPKAIASRGIRSGSELSSMLLLHLELGLMRLHEGLLEGPSIEQSLDLICTACACWRSRACFLSVLV